MNKLSLEVEDLKGHQRRLKLMRELIIKSIKRFIKSKKLKTVNLYDNDVFIVNYDQDAFIISISSNGKTVIVEPKNFNHEDGRLSDLSVDLLILIYDVLIKNEKKISSVPAEL